MAQPVPTVDQSKFPLAEGPEYEVCPAVGLVHELLEGERPDVRSAASMAQLFKALGDERRLLIVRRVAAQPDICACHLLEEFDMSQPTLSHHMKLLCASGVLAGRKQGKWMHYSVDPAIADVIAAFERSLR
ncbi:MAG: metalloregulator ArsR/SmtB family transcription factor [Coriobacteriia bacterium]|nr:metalloregulator ArsR/SmtB family transcription factor [Coriobacteriia bacterium]